MNAYRDSAAPPTSKPRRFSPLRPVMHALWWWLAEWQPWPIDSRDRFDAIFLGWGIIGTCFGGAMIGFVVMLVTAAWTSSQPSGFVFGYAWGAHAVLLFVHFAFRAWLRAAMHLDDPDSFAWWKAKFGR